ncbi:MAG: bifunctional adenosylcobinamide kinase/adenosylcobinamide-phosphate guanylyltransferase, partial [Acetatifactor sp.]|nr:bifunctional adenosylcobinamide kinase/adenosylcobinamide-phosphate guanylyltransferase [Acetatifactor sp.]
MILIVGGAYQGKTGYAKDQFGAEYTIVDDYHLLVKNQLEQGLNPMEEAEHFYEKIMQKHTDEKTVVITAEQGYGVVPVDAFERNYREQAGRVNCYLARQAKSVIRVICG